MKTQRFAPLLVIAGSFVLLVVAAIVTSPSAPPAVADTDPRATTFSAAPQGARAIYLVLDRFLPGVERWMKPLQTIAPPGDDAPGTLLVLQPTAPLDEDDANALDGWLAQGGQLILADGSPWNIEGRESGEDYLSRHGFVMDTEARDARLYASPGGAMLLDGMPLAPGDYEPLFGGPDGAVGAQRAVGDGRIVVITDGYAWSNDRLSRSRNAAWLVRTVGAWGNGRLLVDEYHLGTTSTRGAPRLVLSFLGTFWGFAFLQAGLAALLFLFRRARRFGPAVDLQQETVQDPLERIRGIGSLLQAAEAREFSVQAMAQLAAARQRGQQPDAGGDADPTAPLDDDGFLRIARATGRTDKGAPA
jgi:hypothetical protein